MSVSVTSKRHNDSSHQSYASHPSHAPLPHTVVSHSPHGSAAPHPNFSSNSTSSASHSSHSSSHSRTAGKPHEETKQIDPEPRLSNSVVSSLYSSSSISSTAQHQYEQHAVPDVSHHAIVSFAPLPVIAAVHSSPHRPSVQLVPDTHPHIANNLTASTASHSSTNSYLPATRQPHPHSDTEDEGEEEEVEEGAEAEGEQDEYEEEEESVDNSPRDGRILTFADEHGVQLCAFYVYDPNAVQNVTPRPGDKQAGGGGGSGGGESERRKESGKVTRVERADSEANCQCCIS